MLWSFTGYVMMS